MRQTGYFSFALAFAFFAIAFVAPRSLAFIGLIPGVVLFLVPFNIKSGLHTISKPLLCAMLGVGLIALLSLSTSLYPDKSLSRIIKVSIIAVCGLIGLAGYRKNPDVVFKTVPKASLYGALTALIFIIINLLTNFHMLRFLFHYSNDVKPYVFNHTAVALFLLGIPFSYIHIKQNKTQADYQKRRDILLYFTGILFLLFLAVTENQGVQIALIFGLFFYFIFPSREKWAWRHLKIGLAWLILSTPWILQISNWVFKNKPDLFETYFLKHGAGKARIEIWRSLSNYVLENPLYGYGINVTKKLPLDINPEFWDGHNALHPHNYALQLWLELGVIGAIAGAAITVFVVHKIQAIKDRHIKKLALVTFIGWLCIALTGYGLWQSWWFGLTLTLIIVWSLIIKKYDTTFD